MEEVKKDMKKKNEYKEITVSIASIKPKKDQYCYFCRGLAIWQLTLEPRETARKLWAMCTEPCNVCHWHLAMIIDDLSCR
jgi:hypothetical protein